MNRSQFLERFNRDAKRERSPQHRAARIKRERAAADEESNRRHRLKRKRELKTNRKDLSIAQGLKTYRELRNMTRSEFAETIGTTRRALHNYEIGQRGVPGELIESIAKKGDLELHEIFGISFERAPIEYRRSDANIAIRLYLSLREQFSETSASEVSHIAADDADIQRFAADAAASWPTKAKATEKSIANVATRLAHQLADYYALTDMADM